MPKPTKEHLPAVKPHSTHSPHTHHTPDPKQLLPHDPMKHLSKSPSKKKDKEHVDKEKEKEHVEPPPKTPNLAAFRPMSEREFERQRVKAERAAAKLGQSLSVAEQEPTPVPLPVKEKRKTADPLQPSIGEEEVAVPTIEKKKKKKKKNNDEKFHQQKAINKVRTISMMIFGKHKKNVTFAPIEKEAATILDLFD